ncbi:MAG: aminotransferase class V-fold PLP-dependent enzyme [Pirellulales bacterium]|nr:aminotransferase class V-fold PLP-dependent enzyme [Pirellulales bacterium]
MRITSGPFAWPIADDEVREALAKSYRDGSWGIYDGPEGEQLAAELCQYFGCEHALLCSSGTIGVELALRGCGVTAGDEVVLGAYDFPGNFRAVEAIGARPVLVDVSSDTWSLDAEQLAEIIRPEVKAVIVSHLHGGLVDMPAVVALARGRGWSVIEDACQQPGAQLGGRAIGSWGDVGVLSFGGSKLLTAGRGGALLTSDAQILQRVKIYCDRGNQAFPLSELQSAVLRPQLSKLRERNRIRGKRVAQILAQTTQLSPWLRPALGPANAEPAFFKLAWSYLPAESQAEMREPLLAELQAAAAPFGAGFRGFASRSGRRCEKPLPLATSVRLSQSTILLHHPVLLAQEKAAHEVTAVLDYFVRELVLSNK